MRIRTLPLIAVFGVAAFLTFAAAEPAPMNQGGTRQIGNIPRATAAVKLARAKTLFKLNTTPKSLSSSFSLTVNQPMIPNKGSMQFFGFREVYATHLFYGHAVTAAGDTDPAGGPPEVVLTFSTPLANKSYLATFYLKPLSAQTIRFDIEGAPAQLVELTSLATGPTMIAFKSTQSGGGKTIRITAPGGMRFYGVDVDVVD